MEEAFKNYLMPYLDPSKSTNYDLDDYVWNIRSFAIHIAQQSPFQLFDINEEVREGASKNRFWTFKQDGNHELRQNHELVVFWLMVTLLFDHPWVQGYLEKADYGGVKCRKFRRKFDEIVAEIKEEGEFSDNEQFHEKTTDSNDDKNDVSMNGPTDDAANRRLIIVQHKENAQRAKSQLEQEGKITVSPLQTYQGRERGSSNACIAIAAKIAAKHLQSQTGVTDEDINTIIDVPCAPLIKAVRQKHNLSEGAFVLPDHVTTYMTETGQLESTIFDTTFVGSVVDSEKLEELCSCIGGFISNDMKVSALFFFKHHAVAILKYPTSPTEAVYDLIESLPNLNGMGSRTRCTSLEALKSYLEWYTSNKFGEVDFEYFQQQTWEETLASNDSGHQDSRQFLAFVWTDDHNFFLPSNILDDDGE